MPLLSSATVPSHQSPARRFGILAALIAVAVVSFGLPPLAVSLESDTVGDEQVRVVLGSSHGSIEPGTSIPIAMVMTPIEGWHLYWSNPGDSGMPPDIRMTLPEGAQLGGEWQLPPPGHIIHGGLGTYALKGEVVITNTLELKAAYDAENIPLEVTVNWLVCDDNMCLPGNASLSLTIPVGAAAETADRDQTWQTRLDQRATLDPQTITGISIVSAHTAGDTPERFGLALPEGLIAEGEGALFVPPDNSWVSAGKAQVLRPHAGSHILELPRTKDPLPPSIQGVLVILSEDELPLRSYHISR